MIYSTVPLMYNKPSNIPWQLLDKQIVEVFIKLLCSVISAVLFKFQFYIIKNRKIYKLPELLHNWIKSLSYS